MSETVPVTQQVGLPATLVPATEVPFGMSAKFGDLVTALASVQAVLESPARNKHVSVERPNGERYDFRYASLDVINDMIRGPLAENGLVLVHLTRPTKAGLFLLTRLLLKGTEQSMENVTPIYLEHKTPHSFASAVTYAKRYAICTLLNIAAEEDDDGNAAQGNRVIDHSLAGEPEAAQAALRARFSRLIASANEARSSADVAGVLRAWQRDAADYGAWGEDPKRADEWELLLRLVPSAIRRVHGPEMAEAWAGGVKARTLEDLALLRERWTRDWTPAAGRMRSASPAGFALLMESMRVQTARVELAAGAAAPAEPPGGSRGVAPEKPAASPEPVGSVVAPRPASAEKAEVSGHALFDEEGDPVSEPYSAQAAYAEAYIEQDAYADSREALRAANAAGIAWCTKDPAAAALLHEQVGPWVFRDGPSHAGVRGRTTQPSAPAPAAAVAEQQGSADPPPQEQESRSDSDAPPLIPVPLAATARGTPDLGRYLVAVKRSLLQAEGCDDLDAWEAANAPTYSALPQSTRLQVLAAKASREQVLGIPRKSQGDFADMREAQP